ncbi:MAG: lactonase family protein [Nitrospira sp.]|nr:lactonase family protein [Nitrospira sp.]
MRSRSSANRFRLAWLMPLVFLAPGCGDEGGGGGFGSGGSPIGGGEPTAASVYVTNSGSDNISAYTVNGTTGGLSAIAGSPVANVSTPSAIAVSRNGFFAFATNSQTNQVTSFRIGTDGGLLLASGTATSPNPASVGTAPSAVAISSNTEFLYVANRGSDSVTAFTIGATGVLTLVPPEAGMPNPVAAGGSAPVSLVGSATDSFLYVANSADNTVSVFQIETNGLLKLVPPTGSLRNPVAVGGNAPSALALSSTGQFLYVANRASNNVTVFQVETSGLLTLVPPVGSGTNPQSIGGTGPIGIAVAPDGQVLYTANEGGTVSALTIGTNGLLTLVPSSGNSSNPIQAGTNPSAITISQDGQFLYVANRGGGVSAYTVVSGTGTLVPLPVLLGNPFPTGTTPSGIAMQRPL